MYGEWAAVTGALFPGVLVVIAGAVQGDGAVLTAAFRNQSPVSDEQLSFPWTGSTAILTSVVWGAAQVLILIGLVAFARAHAPAGSGRTGARMAVVGAALHVAAHALSTVAHDADLEDPVAILVLSLFGLGTLLSAVGLVISGVAMRRSGSWTAWRRSAPLALGLWMLAMIPLQFTAALPVAVLVYAAATIALGIALAQETLLTELGGPG